MPPRVLAILFADVSGSTALYEKLGDRGALAAVESVIEVLRQAATAAQGRVVKTIGDEIMAVFPDAAAAARAAMDMQLGVAALPAFGQTRLSIRVGFQFGSVLEETGDVFGDAVNTAARLTGLAKAGQILTSAAAVEALPAALGEATRDLDGFTVKGKQDEVRVVELLWQDAEDLTQSATRALLPSDSAVLRLAHSGQSLVMGPDLVVVLVGRDPGNQIVIAHRTASRLHGRFERRRDKYFYIDLSTNGTYVTVEGQAELLLCREQIMLRGRGALAIGHPAGDARAELIGFSVE